MNSELFNSLTTVALAIIGLGVIATLVSKNANTAGILAQAAGGLGGAIQAAQSPVTSSGGLMAFPQLSGAGFQNY